MAASDNLSDCISNNPTLPEESSERKVYKTIGCQMEQ